MLDFLRVPPEGQSGIWQVVQLGVQLSLQIAPGTVHLLETVAEGGSGGLVGVQSGILSSPLDHSWTLHLHRALHPHQVLHPPQTLCPPQALYPPQTLRPPQTLCPP